jgi:hypothetical protein
MVVERAKGEIIIRLSDTIDISELQNMIDYIRYKELVSKSQATQEEIDEISELINAEIWDNYKEQNKFN